MFERLRYAGLQIPDLKPRYNICPTQMVLTVRNDEEQTEKTDAKPDLALLRWGLVPFWAKELKIGAKMINARSETVATKPAFRAAFKSRRCLVVADGFFEWKKEGTGKQPYYISRRDAQPYCMAGLWETWKDPQPSLFEDETANGTIETCTILTTAANEFMAPLHDRMPVVMSDPEQVRFWLDRDFSDQQTLEGFLAPTEWDDFQSFPVSRNVNFVRNDGPELILPSNS